jgi:hypothetical protein
MPATADFVPRGSFFALLRAAFRDFFPNGAAADRCIGVGL